MSHERLLTAMLMIAVTNTVKMMSQAIHMGTSALRVCNRLAGTDQLAASQGRLGLVMVYSIVERSSIAADQLLDVIRSSLDRRAGSAERSL